jgi:hypothetical protein
MSILSWNCRGLGQSPTLVHKFCPKLCSCPRLGNKAIELVIFDIDYTLINHLWLMAKEKVAVLFCFGMTQ